MFTRTTYAKHSGSGGWVNFASGMASILLAVLFISALIHPANAFHYPWDQGHDTTDWDDPLPPGPCEGPLCTPCGATGSPVYLPTGHFLWRETDVDIFGIQPLRIARSYNSNDPRAGVFGNGWTSGCEDSMTVTVGAGFADDGTPQLETRYVLRLEDGKRYEFLQIDGGSIVPPAGRYEVVTVNGDGSVNLNFPGGALKIYSAAGQIIQHTNRAAKSLFYTYDASNRLTRVRDDFNRDLTMTYNAGGRVQTVADFTGRVWTYAYDAVGNLTSVQDPLGGSKQYTYQPHSPAGDGAVYYQLTSVTDQTGVVTSSVNYLNERVTSYTAGSDTFSYSYNDTLNRTIKTDSTGRTWTYFYDDNQLITSETDPAGSQVSTTYDENGNVLSTSDEEGQVWIATFDTQGRPLTESDPLGNTIMWEYAGTNEWPIKMTTPSGREIETQYDAQGNLVRYQDASGAAVTNTWSADSILQSSTSASGNTTQYASNAFGWRTSTTDPLGRVTSTVYDGLGRTISETDPDGNTKLYAYDLLGRVVTVSDPLGNQVNYTYDAAGKVTSMTDARGNVQSFTYDTLGRLESRISADGEATAHQYNGDNSLASVTHPDGTVVSYSYDAMKRLLTKTVDSLQFAYEYNGRGDLTRAENAQGVLTRSYNNAGQFISESFNGEAVDVVLNADGERVSVAYLGDTTQYQRDNRGMISSIVDVTGTYTMTYDANGFRTALMYPNATTVAYGWDDDFQLESIAHIGTFNDNRAYVFDGSGNITQQIINSSTRTFSYDANEQLLGASYPADTFSFSYDDAGNIEIGGRTYDVRNRLLSDSTREFAYDDRGNLIRKQEDGNGRRTEYQWSSQSELLRVERYPSDVATVPDEVVEYFYGPLGRRVGKSVNGVRENFLYDGYNRIGTLDATGAPLSRFVYGPAIDELLGERRGVSNRFYYHDHQQSVIAVADDNGVVQSFDYSPYGALISGDASFSDFGYTGRELDADDLYFYRSRYYDPTMQRFISEDPLGLTAGVNMYAYVEGNPVNNIDPLGLQIGSASWCRRQLERIRNIERKIQERIGELNENPQNLPESCPGDFDKPSLSRRGHRKLINMDKANLAAQRALYAAYCRFNPPPVPVPVPAPQPAPNTNPNTGVDWDTVGAVAVGVVVIVGIGALIYFSGGTAAPLVLAPSDVNLKHNVEPVDKQAILNSVVELDVNSWTYNWESSGVKHIGPMAQDFSHAFGLGESDTAINLVDSNGVLYVAIQALNEKIDSKDIQIEKLEVQIEQQRILIDQLINGRKP